MATVEDLRETLKRFQGKLDRGRHTDKDVMVCALELLSVHRGRGIEDSPSVAGCLDFRRLNDLPVSPALRTEHMLPLLSRYWDSYHWSSARVKRVLAHFVKTLSEEYLNTSDKVWGETVLGFVEGTDIGLHDRVFQHVLTWVFNLPLGGMEDRFIKIVRAFVIAYDQEGVRE